MAAIKRVQTTNQEINQLQTNLIESLTPLVNNVLLKGHFLTNVTLTTGITNVIPLGTIDKFNGWHITRLNAQSTIWDTQILNNTPNVNLFLNCSANCIVTIYVF